MPEALTAATTATVQRLYADYAQGKAETVLEALDPAVSWVSVGCEGIPWAGAYQGPEGVLQFLERLGNAVELLSYQVDRIIAQGEWAVVLATARGRYRASGQEQVLSLVDVLRLREGRVVEFREFYDSGAVLAALPPILG